MPLNPDAERLIRGNFSMIKRGKNPRRVVIGQLTPAQLAAINANRIARKWDPITADVLFHGKHLYDSRIKGDGYTEDEVLEQVKSAMAEESEFKLTPKMTVLRNPALRADGRGSRVHDEAVLECTSQHPLPILYSVIPKGDKLPTKKEGPPMAALPQEVADPPG
jgi:hypothetical protein